MANKIIWDDEQQTPNAPKIKWDDEQTPFKETFSRTFKEGIYNMPNPIFGGAFTKQTMEGLRALGQLIEMPAAGLRSISKQGYDMGAGKAFMEGVKHPEEYPVGTFASNLVNAGLNPTLSGALGTLADVGYYWGLPEAITRLTTVGKVKLLEGTIENINKAISKAGVKQKGVVKIDVDTLKTVAENKDIGTITKAYFKSKGVELPQLREVPKALEAPKSPIWLSKGAIAEHPAAHAGEKIYALDPKKLMSEKLSLVKETLPKQYYKYADKINPAAIIAEADSSRGLAQILKEKGIKPESLYYHTGKGSYLMPPKFAENINLETMPQDVRGKIFNIISDKPVIGKTPAISDAALLAKAQELKSTPTIDYLTNLSEGTLESEALKLRQGNTQLIREALANDLTKLKTSLDLIIEHDLAKQRKVVSIFGRGLRQQQISPDAQQELAFSIEEKINQVKKDPILKNDTELLGTLGKLKDTVIDKNFNLTIWNKAYYIWLNSILSNPFTHLTNTASNTIFALAKIPEKFASAVWDLPISLFTKQRTQYFGEIPAMVKGAFSKEPLPVDIIKGSKLDFYSKPLKGVAGKVIGAPTELLQLEDNLAKNLVGKMEYQAQIYKGVKGEELTSAVQEEMLYRTFQDEASQLGQALKSLRGQVPFVRWIMPFVNTPDRLITRGLERTPLQAAKVIGKAVKGEYTQAELAKDLGLLSLGSLLAGLIAIAYKNGRVTGNVPSRSAERDAFYRSGRKPNAVKIGEYWIPLDRLDPLGVSFSVVVNLIQDYQASNQDIPEEKVLDAVKGLSKTLTNKTYLSGMTNFIKSISDPEMYGADFLRRITSGSIPNVLSFFAQLKDPYYRQADSVLDYMKAKIPFASETLEPKLNVFGEPVKRDLMNIGKEKTSPLEEAIKDTPVGFPSRLLSGQKLTDQEYNRMLKESGGNIKRVLESIAANPRWLKIPVEQREKIIKDIESRYRKIERGKIRQERMGKIKWD